MRDYFFLPEWSKKLFTRKMLLELSLEKVIFGHFGKREDSVEVKLHLLPNGFKVQVWRKVDHIISDRTRYNQGKTQSKSVAEVRWGTGTLRPSIPPAGNYL